MQFLEIIIELLICLILTIVIEYIPIVKFLGISKKYFIAVNTLTNVLANIFIIILGLLWGSTAYERTTIIIIEIVVIITEIILYSKYLHNKNMLKNIVLTTFANVLSEFFGVVILTYLIVLFRFKLT